MNRDPQPPTPTPAELLSDDSLRLVLRASAAAANPEPAPIEHVIARLEQEDGATWFARRAAVAPWRDLAGGADALADQSTPVDALRRFKDECKQTFLDERDADEVLYAVVGYFLAIASARLHHGEAISSQSARELRPQLIELATALPEPWSSLASRAAFADEARG